MNRLVMAEALVADLPATLAAWQAGVIDSLKARAIAETSYLLPGKLRGALEDRVLPRAGEQTVTRLRARLARAVLVLDPDGAQARHEARRKDRRVVVSPDGWPAVATSDGQIAQTASPASAGAGCGSPRANAVCSASRSRCWAVGWPPSHARVRVWRVISCSVAPGPRPPSRSARAFSMAACGPSGGVVMS